MQTSRYAERYKSHHDCYKALKDTFKENTDKKDYLNELMSIKQDKLNKVIYIHVPYCNKICSFCSFVNKSIGNKEEYHKYLIDKIDEIKEYEYMKSPISSIYFGGGTPTALSPNQMEVVLKKLHKSFNIVEGAEISVETSCTELTEEMLVVLKRNGVNRLSIGVQSFNDKHRKLLGRRGSGMHAFNSVKRAKQFINNVGIDLIYNVPGQTTEELKDDVDKIISLNLAGISFYSLRIHEDTPLHHRLTLNERNDMLDLKKEYDHYEYIIDTLKVHKYELFELTKLICNEMDRYDYIRIKHNFGDCIPIGHGSGGHIGRYYLYNLVTAKHISDDLRLSNMGGLVDDRYKIIDMLIFDLQKMAVDLNRYSKLLDLDLKLVLEHTLLILCKDDYITYTHGIIKLTKKGVFWGNNIIDEFVRIIVGYISLLSNPQLNKIAR